MENRPPRAFVLVRRSLGGERQVLLVGVDHLAVLVDEHDHRLGRRLGAGLARDVAGAQSLVHDAQVTVGDDQRLLVRGVEQDPARALAGLTVAVGGVERAQRRDLGVARRHRRHDGHVALAAVDRRPAEAFGERADQLGVAVLGLRGHGAIVIAQFALDGGGVGDQHDAAVGRLGDLQVDFFLHGLAPVCNRQFVVTHHRGYGQRIGVAN